MSAYADFNWSKEWTSSIGYSFDKVDNTNFQDPTAFRKGQYASVNLLWHPADNVFTGGELLWGKRTDNDGESGSDVRFQYSYTGDSWNDVACDPALAEAGGSTCTAPLRQAPYQISDASIGIEGQSWDLTFSIDNIFDERAQLFRPFAVQPPDRPDGYCASNLCDVTVNRPVEYGLSFTKRWGD